jgi:hypothetical protein
VNAYPWLVWLHVVGAFVFALGHGTSAVVSFRVRGERERPRIAALLDVSQASQAMMYVGLLVLLAGGIAAGVAGQWFGQLWLWAAIATLVVVLIAMYSIASPYYGGLRAGLGQQAYQRKGETPKTVSDAELAALLDSRRPEVLAAIGIVGLAIILWLMVFKPS